MSLLKAAEHRLMCGYGPRALHLAHNRKALFVGCKDGSIQAVIPRQGTQGDEPPYTPHPLTGRTDSGIRSLSEWQSDWLWVVRRGGEMELVDVGSLHPGQAPAATYPLTESLPKDDRVRIVGWIDADQRFVSLRESGTWVLKSEKIIGSDPTPSWNSSLRQKTDLKVQGKPLSGVLFVVPLGAGSDRSFLMANQQGQLFLWDGNQTGEVEERDLWPKGEEPAFVNDVAILWNDEEREKRASARGVFLATDRGVYLLHAGLGFSPRCRRIDLPGLGALCMALTYAEPKNLESCYLWAVAQRHRPHPREQ